MITNQYRPVKRWYVEKMFAPIWNKNSLLGLGERRDLALSPEERDETGRVSAHGRKGVRLYAVFPPRSATTDIHRSISGGGAVPRIAVDRSQNGHPGRIAHRSPPVAEPARGTFWSDDSGGPYQIECQQPIDLLRPRHRGGWNRTPFGSSTTSTLYGFW